MKRASFAEFLVSRFVANFMFHRITDLSVTKPHLAIHSRDWIGLQIMLEGVYEEPELSFLCEITKTATRGVALDVGANIGNHTVYFSNVFKKVYSFEPSPDNFPLLQYNTRLIPNVFIYNIGASSSTKSLEAMVPPGNYGGTSLHLNLPFSDSNQFRKVIFNLMPLDELNELQQENISLIKVDVEGHEYDALRGMERLIRKNMPFIAFEQNLSNTGEIRTEVIDYLRSLGYNQFFEMKVFRNWRFSSASSSIISKISRFLEGIFFGLPEIKKQLVPVNQLERKPYSMIIAASGSRKVSVVD